ncbi:hypothetical protein BC349_12670 [Flavihumibacter stibioxidans]|uniref:Cupin type-2 domain-containing protein n=1 Tax=Flavihumibacter stibioxidans TaxID=1834163 RepID=A0ABR7MA36_9BACT|nr:cupin domain-containing protein [Flavihumibacter stibioxidans]MBC6491908.1 hypothetical protein [Flavihumibacter stibioxidans]
MISKDRQGNESMCFCREEIASGEAIPVHKHLNEDELIFAYAGEATMRIGQKEIILKQGAVALIPKGVWHGVRNTGKEKFIMVFSYSPAGFEEYFREMGSPAGTPWQPKSQAEFDRLEKKWGIVYE